MLYISYDGIGEPLGRSQVLAYLVRLARTFEVTLISFEKPGTDRVALHEELAAHRIASVPLRYHRRPPVISTLFDVLVGVWAANRTMRGARPAIVHVRSYVPALIALLARRHTAGKLLFDIRGFWADQRAEGGLWQHGGPLYRLAKRCERRFFREADAIVTLTQASVPQIQRWVEDTRTAIEVIPTCADIESFERRLARPGGPHVVWCGSVGTWYRFDLAPKVADALSLPLTVITRQVEPALELLNGAPARVYSAKQEQVPNELFVGDVGLCLLRSSFSRVATAPTRLGEYLAAGMPVILTPGIGDADAIIERNRIGVVLRGDDVHAISAAAREIETLTADPDLGDRCRRVARERFDLESGASKYAALYRRLLEGPPAEVGSDVKRRSQAACSETTRMDVNQDRVT